MLPSLEARIASVIGAIAGLSALFFADWGLQGVPDYVWKMLAAVAVLCLLVRRQLPNVVFDDAALRARVGDAQVSRLNAFHNAAMVFLVIGMVIALGLAPFLPDMPHLLTVAAFAALFAALSIYGYVEVRFRSLLHRAGMFGATQPRG